MTDPMDVLKLTTPLFRHKELRKRLNATVDILANWHYVTFEGGGALVGGIASFGGVWRTLSHQWLTLSRQRRQAREARLLEIGQVAADQALNELITLGEFLGSLGGNDVVTAMEDEIWLTAQEAGHP
ncbi:hypothetical protein [Streptomyces iranensis]|uniref:hypothetical protein n=1 Tax=Streptomyces iranensis TaxID=576784 RepID=UPI0039B735A0